MLMKSSVKVFAIILFIPVIAILLHTYIPHHHHENCFEQIHKHSSLSGCFDHHEENPNHSKSSGLHDLNHATSKDVHYFHCHLKIEFRNEKKVCDVPYIPDIFTSFSPDQKTYIPDFHQEHKVNHPLIFNVFLRGPPILA